MSRAFVKESEGDRAIEELPDRPISPHPNVVTPEGLALIEATLVRLHEQHANALAAGDRAALSKVMRDLRYFSARRATAHVMTPPSDPSEVQFGSTVTIERDDGRRQTYRIVGEDEADPANGKLSYVSPVARALMGKRVAEVVRAGTSNAQIVEIR
jgi:transcription elongation GreA/GreB family factor